MKIEKATGARCRVKYGTGYPPTINMAKHSSPKTVTPVITEPQLNSEILEKIEADEAERTLPIHQVA